MKATNPKVQKVLRAINQSRYLNLSEALAEIHLACDQRGARLISFARTAELKLIDVTTDLDDNAGSSLPGNRYIDFKLRVFVPGSIPRKVVKPKVAKEKCTYWCGNNIRTSRTERCKRDAIAGSKYCGQHDKRFGKKAK